MPPPTVLPLQIGELSHSPAQPPLVLHCSVSPLTPIHLGSLSNSHSPSPTMQIIAPIPTLNVSQCIYSQKNPSPASPSSTASSDESEQLIIRRKPMMAHLTSSLASVEHLVFNQPPVVSAGNLSPRIIYDFDQFCQDFFANAKTPLPNDKKVIRILPCFQDPL
ncbi:hypothetical protein BYT27DRAFT_7336932, partial [Phlegmacium glaucopus]